jgi:hypothetical protein
MLGCGQESRLKMTLHYASGIGRAVLAAGCTVLFSGAAPAATIPISAPAGGPAAMAAAELSRALAGVWTDCTFPVGAAAPAEGRRYVGGLLERLEPWRHRFMLSASCNTSIRTPWETLVWFRDAWREFGAGGR